ncbi:MAG: LicD family protein [SAR202 cluster bacterium]|nr:LicD family protein [SAR202 cluster bacterium]
MFAGNGSDLASLEYTNKYNPPIDVVVAANNLKEAKQIMGRLGVVFVLGSGTCLGAIRDNALIPWDDDVDLMSVISINGLTAESMPTIAEAFRHNGFFTRELPGSHSQALQTIKGYVRVTWESMSVIDDTITIYPGIKIPANMLSRPKEIEFLGEKFFVPNPPEEYLRLKYGAGWTSPRKPGAYERDVVEKIPDATLVGRPSTVRVLDHEGNPVADAEVALVGGGRYRTDERGYAEIILPGPDWYALVIKYPGHEEVLYMEELEPDKSYVYRADAASNAASQASGDIGTLGDILSLE